MRFVGGAVSGILSLPASADAAPRHSITDAGAGSTNGSKRWSAVTPLVGLGGLAEPPIAQDHSCTLQLRFDTDSFDIAFEADAVAIQIMFDVQHPARLHEQFVVREPVAHLVGGGTMSVVAQNPPQPPQVGGKLLYRNTLLVAQFTYGPPMGDRGGTPLAPPPYAFVPSSGQHVVDEQAQNRDEDHEGDGNTTKYYLVQVHRHEITLSRALGVHKLRPERETRLLPAGAGEADLAAFPALHGLDRAGILGRPAAAVDRNVYVVHVIGSR